MFNASEKSLEVTWSGFFMTWKTPNDRLYILALTILVYVTLPIIQWENLQNNLVNGVYRVDADSIGLGLFQFIFVWVLFAPFVLTFMVWVLGKYPPSVLLFGHNSKRIVWSFCWTLIFGFLFFIGFALAAIDISQLFFVGAIQNLLLGYLFLLFRASIVFRT